MKWTRHLGLLFLLTASLAKGQFNAAIEDSTESDNVFIYEDPKGFGKVLDLVNLPLSAKSNKIFSVSSMICSLEYV